MNSFIVELNAARDSGPAFLARAENHIVLGDGIEAMRRLPDESVALIHTSPPYNIDKGYRAHFRDRRPIDGYADFLSASIAEMRRVLKRNGSLFWQTGYTDAPDSVEGDILPIDHLSYAMFREEPDPLILWDRVIWRYFGGMAFKRKFTNKHETILWLVKPGDGRANPTFNLDEVRERSRELDKRNNFWGRNPGNVWEADRVAFGSTEATSHIAVYPEEITERIIRACSNPGDLVLDPFSGSGTTPKVARGLSRRWMGLEISDIYASESATRIGFQQPSELSSLASQLTKSRVFGRQRGTRTRQEVLGGLVEWSRSFDARAHRDRYERLLGEVFPAGSEGAEAKAAKPETWQRFDKLLDEGRDDPIVEVDDLLVRDYRNRQHLNSPHRYRSALTLAEQLLAAILGAQVDEFIGQMLLNEPSSYLIEGEQVHLLQTEKLAKTVGDGWDEWLEDLRKDESVIEVPGPVLAAWAGFARQHAVSIGEESFADLLDDGAMFSETRRLADDLGSDLFWLIRDEVIREFGSIQKLGRRQVFGLIARALDELSTQTDPVPDASEHSHSAAARHDGSRL